jgi:hypothetical protein
MSARWTKDNWEDSVLVLAIGLVLSTGTHKSPGNTLLSSEWFRTLTP